MTDRLKALSATVLTALGFPPAPDASVAPANAEAPAAGYDDDEDEMDPKTGKKKPKPMEGDADADAAANAGVGDAALTAAMTETASAAAAAATAAANARWASVLGHDDAKGRTAQAVTLLSGTAMNASEIITALAGFPKETATGGLSSRMAEIPNPAVTADGAAADTDPRADNHGWDKSIARVFGAVRK